MCDLVFQWYRLSMKYFIYLVLAIVLVSCGEQQFPAMPTGATVVVLGDSLSYGTGANEGEDYPALLEHNTDWHIINAGIPGNTSQQGLARLTCFD